MTIVALCMNLLLAGLLFAALMMGWRLNRRLQALRDSHDGFATAVHELDIAAARAEQGLADLRAATDEAVDTLGDRIEKGRALALKLERLVEQAVHTSAAAALSPARAPEPPRQPDPVVERRLGALLAAAREARPDRLERRDAPPSRLRSRLDDELFDDEPLMLDKVHGARR